MNRNIACILIICFALGLAACQQNANEEPKFTAINPLSYTDVCYTASKDTAIVSTYSGRIGQWINGQSKETLISQVKDEIYSLAYSKARNEIYASTLNNGVLVIDGQSGRITQTLEVNKYWINTISLSKDENYLMGFDRTGKNYIWDISKDYSLIKLPDTLPRSFVRFMDNEGLIYLTGSGKVIKWNTGKGMIDNEFEIGGRLVDADQAGNLLLINHNSFSVFESDKRVLSFSHQHPSWIYGLASGDTVHIPYQMQLTSACFAKDKVFTAGIDRSIRVWNKTEGRLIDDWIGHKATISGLDVAEDESQLVSVDLKGGIRFWDLEPNDE